VASGTGTLLTIPKDEDEDEKPIRHELAQGDFAFIPAWTEHQASNESGDTDMVWVITRSGPHPVEVHLTSWGGPEAKAKDPKP
jgi:mannose-6-phosphate isomerase-like protein (cupin superfamily)